MSLLHRGLVLGREREKQRVAHAKRLVKARAAANAEWDKRIPELEKVEEAALTEFKAASARLEEARAKADAAYFARTNAQAEIERRLAAIDGELFSRVSPLYFDLCAKLTKIANDARKIDLVVEERNEAPDPKYFVIGARKGRDVRTNRAARYARQFLPSRISNALAELVLGGLDTDENLRAVFDAGVEALPGPEILRPEDDIPGQFSPKFEAAVAQFSAALGAALDVALAGGEAAASAEAAE